MRNLTSLTSFLPEVSNKESDHDGTDFTLCALNFVSFKCFFGPRLYHISYMEVKCTNCGVIQSNMPRTITGFR